MNCRVQIATVAERERGREWTDFNDQRMLILLWFFLQFYLFSQYCFPLQWYSWSEKHSNKRKKYTDWTYLVPFHSHFNSYIYCNFTQFFSVSFFSSHFCRWCIHGVKVMLAFIGAKLVINWVQLEVEMQHCRLPVRILNLLSPFCLFLFRMCKWNYG